MRTIDQVLEMAKKGRLAEAPDRRDYRRLTMYAPLERWEDLGFKAPDPSKVPPRKEWTEANVLADFQVDVAFGFARALDARSNTKAAWTARGMWCCVRMWLFILQDPLWNCDREADFDFYGLPLFKAVAVKFGWPNPIGEDTGREAKYGPPPEIVAAKKEKPDGNRTAADGTAESHPDAGARAAEGSPGGA